MITHEQVQNLLNFTGDGLPVVSVYLNTDWRFLNREQIRLNLKEMIKGREKELKTASLTHDQQESLKADFQHLLHFVDTEFMPGPHKGLAIFSCAGRDFWQVYPLAQRVKNALIVDPDAYVRPLLAILNQYHRYALVLVDQKRAQIFEWYMGYMQDHTALISGVVPGKVRFAGWYGLEEKRVHRHIEQHVHDHMKRIAHLLFRLMNSHGLEYFVLGGKPHELPIFESHLHRYILERIVARIDVEPFSWDINRIKQEMATIEENLRRQWLNQLVEDLITEASKTRKAVLGIDAVLQVVSMGNVRTLLVEEDFLYPGFECLNCGYLSRENQECPMCSRPLHAVSDLYDEVVEAVVSFGGEYFQLPPGSPLSRYQGIGAYLRFPHPG